MSSLWSLLVEGTNSREVARIPKLTQPLVIAVLGTHERISFTSLSNATGRNGRSRREDRQCSQHANTSDFR